QTLRELWRAGAEAQREAAARRRVQGRRGHRDGRRAAVPDADDAGPERDPRRARRRAGEQHRHVVAPRLRHEEAVVAELIALDGERDDRIQPGFQRHHRQTDTGMHRISPGSSRATLSLAEIYARAGEKGGTDLSLDIRRRVSDRSRNMNEWRARR